MTVINLTPDVGVLKNSENDYTVMLGDIKKGSSKTVKFKIENERHQKTSVGCPSCTKATVIEVDNNVELEITYTALVKAPIAKKVTETLLSGRQIVFNLRGNSF